ncbi:hypothetical protein [Rubritalea sp.]|uniref:hypothetical protein n=1 Tax=Rubritalea sp. TaxID=2109375 RepID=UPI003EF58934
MKLHLIIHSVILGGLLIYGINFICIENPNPNLWNFRAIILYISAVISALFGIWNTARYSRNIANGCEVTVATAEAKIFPYMLHFMWMICTAIRFL